MGHRWSGRLMPGGGVQRGERPPRRVVAVGVAERVRWVHLGSDIRPVSTPLTQQTVVVQVGGCSEALVGGDDGDDDGADGVAAGIDTGRYACVGGVTAAAVPTQQSVVVQPPDAIVVTSGGGSVGRTRAGSGSFALVGGFLAEKPGRRPVPVPYGGVIVNHV